MENIHITGERPAFIQLNASEGFGKAKWREWFNPPRGCNVLRKNDCEGQPRHPWFGSPNLTFGMRLQRCQR